MEDKRPIVYAARTLRRVDENGNYINLAYFVSKARLQRETTTYNKKGWKIKEYVVDFDDYDLDLSSFNDIPDCFIDWGEYVTTNVTTEDYQSCKLHVAAKNRELITCFPGETNNLIVERAKKLESVITKKEMQGYCEEKDNNI